MVGRVDMTKHSREFFCDRENFKKWVYPLNFRV